MLKMFFDDTDESDVIYLEANGFYDSRKLIDYDKFRKYIADELSKLYGYQFDYINDIYDVRMVDIVEAHETIYKDTFIPLNNSEIEIVKCIGCKIKRRDLEQNV